MKAYGHAITLILITLILVAGAPPGTVLIPFLCLEVAAVALHVIYEREQWHDE